jgi:heptosyltransferase I
MRLLIVKTSSMGDVVHALPVVADVLRHKPNTQIDWLVEEPFAAIAQMHSGVRRVIPMAWRKWRASLFNGRTWSAMSALRQNLQDAKYDLVLDLQGLMKSALWAKQAGAPVAGYDGASAREPMAAMSYDLRAPVSREIHAVQRCRLLAATHLNYKPPREKPEFGLRVPSGGWLPKGRYSVLIPNASRAEKLWPERHWAAVGKRLSERGTPPLVLWGREEEQTLAERIAADCDGDVPPFLKVGEMAAVLEGASNVVGLDTGFTHLAAALGRPTLGIYCDHEPGLAGLTGPGWVHSLGGKGQVPSRNDVLSLLERQFSDTI